MPTQQGGELGHGVQDHEAMSPTVDELAVRLAAVERSQGEHSMLMTHSNEMVAVALAALQREVGKLVQIGEQQVELQLAAANTSSGLERLNERWKSHEDYHETRDQAFDRISERVSMFRGALVAVVLLSGVVIGVASAYFNAQLQNLAKNTDEGFQATHDQFASDKSERDRIERRQDRLDVLFRESQLK